MATPVKGAGRSTAAYHRIKNNLRVAHAPCYHCGQPINWQTHFPHPDSFTVDHLKPVAYYPELADEPTNCVTSHLSCNLSKGVRDVRPGLGNRSENF